MSSITVSASVSSDEYGSKKLASVSVTVPAVGVELDHRGPSPAQIDELETQLNNRIAQVRRELSAQIMVAREQAEKKETNNV